MLNYNIDKYLEENHNKIALGKFNDFSDLSIINNDLKGKKIFLTGENHGVKANENLRMKFLKYFKEKTDFRYYIWELPFSTTYFLNKYLETGNEEILKKVYKPLKGTFAWNKHSLNHWKELYQFNKKLPKKRKIQIIGIDIEHQPKNAFNYMNYVLSEKTVPVEIMKNIKKLKLFNKQTKFDDNKVKKFTLTLKDDLEEKEDIYKSYLGEDYFGFKFVNENLLSRHEAYYGNNFNNIRDEKMFDNFMKIYKCLPKGKYYGQLGLSHVFQKESTYVNWFGAALNSEHSICKGKILSIVYVYVDCKYLYPTKIKDYIAQITTLDPEVNIFDKYAKSECTLFKLNNKYSPFKRKLIWPIMHRAPKDGVTTNYFQYLIVVKESEAVEPLS